jgi:hypothetical protein
MFGPNALPFFIKEFVPVRTRPFLARNRNRLALGNISYYIQDDIFVTRVYIYNYFSFLCDADIPARYKVELYTRDGKLTARLAGKIRNGAEILELSSIKGLDSFGIMRVYVIPDSPKVFIPHAHSTIFYNEYYCHGSPMAVMAHSLHIPAARHSNAPFVRTSPALLIPADSRPFLLIASGCSFNQWGHPACSTAYLTFINEKGEARKIVVPPMKPLQSQRMREHVGTRPFILKVTGKEYLAKPFIFITNGTSFMGEHL